MTFKEFRDIVKEYRPDIMVLPPSEFDFLSHPGVKAEIHFNRGKKGWSPPYYYTYSYETILRQLGIQWQNK